MRRGGGVQRFARCRETNEALANRDWSFIDSECPDAAASLFSEAILKEATKYIPRENIRLSKSSHPWLTDECKVLVRRKHEAEGSSSYPEAVKQCSEGLLQAYRSYIARPRRELRDCTKGSKRWWKLSHALMNKPEKNCSIPALKLADGNWA